MSTYTETKPMPTIQADANEYAIRQRVDAIKANWSAAERARRQALGRARRQALLVSLGLINQAECA